MASWQGNLKKIYCRDFLKLHILWLDEKNKRESERERENGRGYCSFFCHCGVLMNLKFSPYCRVYLVLSSMLMFVSLLIIYNMVIFRLAALTIISGVCAKSDKCLFIVFASGSSLRHTYTCARRKIHQNMHRNKHGNTLKQHRGRPVLSHKRPFVWAGASLPKLDHSVFDGTRCMSIKETEGLTAGQIKALNLSICQLSVQSQGRAGEERGVTGREMIETRF